MGVHHLIELMKERNKNYLAPIICIVELENKFFFAIFAANSQFHGIIPL